MEKLTDERLREIREGCKGVTPGPWESDGVKNDGFISYEVTSPSGNSLVDTFNSGSIEIHQEDGRGWDEQGRKDALHIARLDPQTVSALVDELLVLREASRWQPKLGWQLVPIEPTKAMLDGARDWSVQKYRQGVGNEDAAGCFKAMIAAAPSPPESPK